MRFVILTHSLVSDWNHGNAHFLRGIVSELLARKHSVRVFEPASGWSLENLRHNHGEEPIADFHHRFPALQSTFYTDLHLDEWLDEADLVLVHEWNDPQLVSAVGRYRLRHPQIRIFFHDTHHRAITAPDEMARFDLEHYDGVLAYGDSLRQAYERLGWGKRVYVWHEAADIHLFHPLPDVRKVGDLIWIGNWGDDERTEELREFFIGPSSALKLTTRAYGVRYPKTAIDELAAAGISYHGWVANYRVPELFAQFRATIHVPRRPYTRSLPGIPTIRPFEALACGIPLISAPWNDCEHLFRSGEDFLIAQNGSQMQTCLRDVLHDRSIALSLVRNGLETIRNRHTCAHRVDELLQIYRSLKPALEEVQA